MFPQWGDSDDDVVLSSHKSGDGDQDDSSDVEMIEPEIVETGYVCKCEVCLLGADASREDTAVHAGVNQPIPDASEGGQKKESAPRRRRLTRKTKGPVLKKPSAHRLKPSHRRTSEPESKPAPAKPDLMRHESTRQQYVARRDGRYKTFSYKAGRTKAEAEAQARSYASD